MTELLFKPGTPISLELPRENNSKLNTFFLGSKKDEYVFVDFPFTSNRYLPVEEDAPCIVRFVTDGKVYAFQSFILKVIKHPFSFLLIAYPQSVDQVNLRSSDRYRVKLDVSYSQNGQDSSDDDRSKGQLIDISEGGCLLKATAPCALETTLCLFFTLPEIGDIKDLEASVQRINKGEDDYELGLRFSNSQSPNHKLIRNYLNQIDKLQIII
jgi:c-di-GMP-binding flagellar brake protein YcgR